MTKKEKTIIQDREHLLWHLLQETRERNGTDSPQYIDALSAWNEIYILMDMLHIPQIWGEVRE